MEQTLTDILLSDNVVENFYQNYNNNTEFKNWIDLILPEVQRCKNLKQDNPWHIYNCLDHILHSVEEMNKQTTLFSTDIRKMLAYTMFLHDIGKPDCYIRRYSKLYHREIDSFFEHNKASQKIAGRVLPKFNFDKNEQEIIKLLVHEHDIFMFITLVDDGNRFHRVLSKELLHEYIGKYNEISDGKTLMKYLIMVGRADNLAQNPKMTKKSLELLDVFDNMLGNS